MKDPYVAEVRKHRMEHTRAFGSDLSRICEDLRRIEGTVQDRLVTPKPKRIAPTPPSR